MARTPTSLIGSRRRQETRGAVGFTLIELAVVMVLVAVLAGMALPRLAGTLATARLRTSARDLLVAARLARDYAATRRTRCRLVIEPAERRFRLEVEAEPRERPGEFVPLHRHLVRARTLGRGIEFAKVKTDAPTPSTAAVDAPEEDGDAARVTFRPDGSSDAAIIQITDGRRTWTLRLAPAAGRPELTPERRDEWLHDREDLDA